MGAQGPKMLSLAAQFGDGILINASHPSDFEDAMAHINEGLQKAGKRRGEVEVTAATSLSIYQDREKALKAATPVVAFIVAGCPDKVLETHNLSIEAANSIREGVVKGKWKEAFSAVTPDMLEVFTIAGAPEECNERISAILKTGVDTIIAGSPIGPDVRKSIQLAGSEVITHFK